MAKRGRPAGKKKPAATSDGEPRPNGEKPAELNDDQKQALFFRHFKKVKGLKEKIASLSGELRAQYKLAKAELGDDARASIADALLLETDEGQAKLEAAIARQARIARWMAVPLGAQAELFGTDRAPATDRAFAAGKAARLQGQPLKPPHDPSVPQFDAWSEGWHAGQKALNDAQKRDDALAFPDDPDAENTLTDTDTSEPLGDDAMDHLEEAAEEA